jgi:hypothetical protein
MANYSICNQTISLNYLENGEIKNKEIEIILPDRPEFCNEDGLALVFELNKLSEKLENQKKLKLTRFLNTFEFKDEEEKTNFLNDQEKIDILRKVEIMSNFNSQNTDYGEKDYLLDVYKLLVRKIYKLNYELDFNWFNPSIQFEKFVQSYLVEFRKYQDVFLDIGQNPEQT